MTLNGQRTGIRPGIRSGIQIGYQTGVSGKAIAVSRQPHSDRLRLFPEPDNPRPFRSQSMLIRSIEAV